MSLPGASLSYHNVKSLLITWSLPYTSIFRVLGSIPGKLHHYFKKHGKNHLFACSQHFPNLAFVILPLVNSKWWSFIPCKVAEATCSCGSSSPVSLSQGKYEFLSVFTGRTQSVLVWGFLFYTCLSVLLYICGISDFKLVAHYKVLHICRCGFPHLSCSFAFFFFPSSCNGCVFTSAFLVGLFLSLDLRCFNYCVQCCQKRRWGQPGTVKDLFFFCE